MLYCIICSVWNVWETVTPYEANSLNCVPYHCDDGHNSVVLIKLVGSFVHRTNKALGEAKTDCRWLSNPLCPRQLPNCVMYHRRWCYTPRFSTAGTVETLSWVGMDRREAGLVTKWWRRERRGKAVKIAWDLRQPWYKTRTCRVSAVLDGFGSELHDPPHWRVLALRSRYLAKVYPPIMLNRLIPLAGTYGTYRGAHGYPYTQHTESLSAVFFSHVSYRISSTWLSSFKHLILCPTEDQELSIIEQPSSRAMRCTFHTGATARAH